MLKLVITEKPSVAQSIAKVLSATKRRNGYLEGNGYLISWCIGHLIELAPPDHYDERYGKWKKQDRTLWEMEKARPAYPSCQLEIYRIPRHEKAVQYFKRADEPR